MALGVLGRKLGMTQWFDPEGNAFGATVIEVEPNVVVQVKEEERDGYRALQLGHGWVKGERINRPTRGHFQKAGVEPRRNLKEFRTEEAGEHEAGQELTVEIFEEGEQVTVSGTSKGRGFAGVMKRHGFAGWPASHGHGREGPRRPGSIGSMAATGKVFKGKKMAGRLGGERVTVSGLEVLKVDPVRNLLVVKGAVPGPKGGLVEVRKGG